MAWDDTFVYKVSKVTSAQMNAIIAKIKSILAEDIIFVDSTTGNASSAKHGYMMKYPGGAGFLRADGLFAVPAGGGVGGSTGATDNILLRSDGTGGATFQASTVTVDDTGNISTAGGFTSTAAGVDIPTGQTYKINGTALAYTDITGAGFGTVTHTVGAMNTGGIVGGNGGNDVKIITNLPSSTTHSSKYIYRADGTDVPLTDGGTGISTAPKRTIWLSGEGGHLPTTTPAGAVTAVTETSTYKVNLKGTLFAAGATDMFKEYAMIMPSNWDGSTVLGTPVFTTAGTDASNHTLKLTLQGTSLATTAANDTAWGTLQTSTYTFASDMSGKIIFGPETSAITIGGTHTGGDLMLWRVGRTGNDTSTNDIVLIGWRIRYQTNATSDS